MNKDKRKMKSIIECDLKSLGIYPLSLRMRIGGVFLPSRWKMQIKLRKLEYMQRHSSNSIYTKLYCKHFERYCQKLGCEIPTGVFGAGLCINHAGGVVVTGNASIGSNCRINAGVNIGEFGKFDFLPDEYNSKHKNAPHIGNNVYIGPGAKIFGAITIGDNVAIGANAVVNKDVPSGSTVVGVPGKIIEGKGSFNMIIYGDASVKPDLL